jgi:hypothetical protein
MYLKLFFTNALLRTARFKNVRIQEALIINHRSNNNKKSITFSNDRRNELSI